MLKKQRGKTLIMTNKSLCYYLTFVYAVDSAPGTSLYVQDLWQHSSTIIYYNTQVHFVIGQN